jgi:hypothetical protein
MMSLSEAAKVTAQSKSTIWRAIKAGRLSATKNDTGEFQIDPAELHRVFPIGTGEQRGSNASVKRDATAADRAATAEIAGLKAMGEMLRDQLSETRKDRDAWRSQADAWRSQAERLLLTQNPATPPPATTTTAERPGLLRRLIG